jgi:enamine deaminase RidA (YjgF/YER057c/UK114 family)
LNLAPNPQSDAAQQLEAAIDQAVAACGGDMRAAISALIVANDFLETEISELMKAVSRAYIRGRFQAYSG